MACDLAALKLKKNCLQKGQDTIWSHLENPNEEKGEILGCRMDSCAQRQNGKCEAKAVITWCFASFSSS